MQEKLLNCIHEYLYTRKIDLKTGKSYIDEEVIKKLLLVSEANNKSILNNVNQSGGQYFHVLNYADGYVDKLKQNIDMISCLFPKRLIVTSFIKQGDMKYLLSNVYRDYKNFIKAGVLELYIETVERDINWNPEKDNNLLPEIMNKSNVMLLTNSYTDLHYEGIKVLLQKIFLLIKLRHWRKLNVLCIPKFHGERGQNLLLYRGNIMLACIV